MCTGLPPRNAGCALSELAINRRVSLEDKALIERVQRDELGSYTMGPLSEGEVCLRAFGRGWKSDFPKAGCRAAPRGWSRE